MRDGAGSSGVRDELGESLRWCQVAERLARLVVGTAVAERFRLSRPAVHSWLGRYGDSDRAELVAGASALVGQPQTPSVHGVAPAGSAAWPARHRGPRAAERGSRGHQGGRTRLLTTTENRGNTR